MTRLPPWVRRWSGVFCGLGLTGRSDADLEEQEPEDDEDGVSMRLGVQELLRRREKEDAGYSSGGSLPPLTWASTVERVCPGVPRH